MCLQQFIALLVTCWHAYRFALLIFSRLPATFQFPTLQVHLHHTFKARHRRHHQLVFYLSPRVPCLVLDQCIHRVHQLRRVPHLFLRIQLAVLLALLVQCRLLHRPFLHIQLVLLGLLVRCMVLRPPFLLIQLAVLLGLLVRCRVHRPLYSLAMCRLALPQPGISSIPHRCHQNRRQWYHQAVSAVLQ